MSYSRRQLYAMGEPLGECVTRKEGGRIIYGGGDSTPAVQTQISDLPEWARGTAQKTLGMAESLTDISQNPYQAYTGPRTAQFSSLQKQAYGNAMGLNAGPQGFAQNVGAYMSPYMQNVVDREKMAAARDSQILGQQQQAQATQAGAFGGYREGIQRAERERGLRSSLQDIQARGTQAAYDQAANQFRQGIGQQLAVNQQQGQFGTQQQQNVQNMLDTQYQDFLNQKRYPYQQLEFMSNILRGTPMGTVNTLYGAGPTMGQQVGALGMGMYGYNQMFGGKNAAEGGMMESYAEGGVTSDQNVESILSKLSDQQLAQARQIAVAQRDMERVQMIDAELAERASMKQGLGSAFNQLPADSQQTMFEAAGGGIVAFADRGLVKEFEPPNFAPLYAEASRLSSELPGAMYTAPTQAETIAGIQAQRGLVQEMMGADKLTPFMEELAAKRKELKDRGGQTRGLAAFAAAGEMLQGSGLGSIGKGISKFGSEIGRLNKENEEADRLMLASQVQLASAQQARADGQFDKASQLFRSAEDLRVKSLDAKRDVLAKQATMQATLGGQALTAASNRYSVERQTEASRANTAENAATRRAMEQRAADDKKFNRLQIAQDQARRVDEAITREMNNPEYQEILQNAGLRDASGKVPEAMKDRVAAAQARVAQMEAGWKRRREEAAANIETARRRYEDGGESAPTSTATRTSGPAIPRTMTMADVEATARASGKTVAEVKAAAQAKGITIK